MTTSAHVPPARHSAAPTFARKEGTMYRTDYRAIAQDYRHLWAGKATLEQVALALEGVAASRETRHLSIPLAVVCNAAIKYGSI